MGDSHLVGDGGSQAYDSERILVARAQASGPHARCCLHLEEHANLFGSGALKSAGADKGYWTANNLRAFTKRGIQECGLQCPGNVKRRKGLPSPKVQERLRNRRAGIEALIGHTKLGGQLGKSRMKSDAATLAAGYASVLGFNLRQISRYQKQRLSGAKAKVA